ncbi:MAG: homoserine O-acetyltransferase [Cyanobacteria bacterium P01_F01_bin.150]
MTIGLVATQFFQINKPFTLDSGEVLEAVTLAYETYGTLNAESNNAILVFHALTGSQHAAGVNANVPGVESLWTDECATGWWDEFIGPGKALDTDRYFIICANYLGSCYGSTGPRSIDPQTGEPYGSSFPKISAEDIVRSQLLLLEHLRIHCLYATVGGSLGGMLAILLATRFPNRVKMVIPLASGFHTTVLQRVQNFEQIVAIRNDPDFQNGDYYDGPHPKSGITLARMISHKTFVSLEVLEKRAKQEVLHQDIAGQWYELSTPIESYMFYQGNKFAARFDANSYLRIMDVWQSYSLEAVTPKIFQDCKHQQYLVFSVDSDVCFYPEEQFAIVKALEAAEVPVKYITVHSNKGHDSFLLEPELYSPYIRFVLTDGCFEF